MTNSYSRRQFLTSCFPVVAVVSIAGCTATSSSSEADCSTEAISHGDGDALQEAMAVADDDGVVLRIVLAEDAIERIDRIVIGDGFDNGIVVPTTDERVYEQFIGERPWHGRYRIVAIGNDRGERVGSTGPAIDSMTIDFHCSADDR